jgi:hypothetical protein
MEEEEVGGGREKWGMIEQGHKGSRGPLPSRFVLRLPYLRNKHQQGISVGVASNTQALGECRQRTEPGSMMHMKIALLARS